MLRLVAGVLSMGAGLWAFGLLAKNYSIDPQKNTHSLFGTEAENPPVSAGDYVITLSPLRYSDFEITTRKKLTTIFRALGERHGLKLKLIAFADPKDYTYPKETPASDIRRLNFYTLRVRYEKTGPETAKALQDDKAVKYLFVYKVAHREVVFLIHPNAYVCSYPELFEAEKRYHTYFLGIDYQATQQRAGHHNLYQSGDIQALSSTKEEDEGKVKLHAPSAAPPIYCNEPYFVRYELIGDKAVGSRVVAIRALLLAPQFIESVETKGVKTSFVAEAPQKIREP